MIVNKLCGLKAILTAVIFATVLLLFVYEFTSIDSVNLNYKNSTDFNGLFTEIKSSKVKSYKWVADSTDYNVWIIFTNVVDKPPLMNNFKNLILNLLNVSSVPLQFNVVVDKSSSIIASEVYNSIMNMKNISIIYTFYDYEECAKLIEDIVSTMTPYFSSRPGTFTLLCKHVCNMIYFRYILQWCCFLFFLGAV